MSEKRFELSKDKGFIFDNLQDDFLDLEDDVDILNNLYDENRELRQQLKQKQEEERLYANEILELRKTNEEFMQFKELGGDY